MSILAEGGLSRDQLFSRCAGQPIKTMVFFEYAYLLARYVGVRYAQAFQWVAEQARASSVKDLLLRFSAALTAGESEREFIPREAKAEGVKYTNEYSRSVESLRTWTDAYAAVIVSVTIVMVISLVSTMLGNLTPKFMVIMGAALFSITILGVYVIYKVAPIEKITYDVPRSRTKLRIIARRLLITMAPLGLILALLIAPQFGIMKGSAIAFMCIGVGLFPAGIFGWLDHVKLSKIDSALPVFLRTLGELAGTSGGHFKEALDKVDTKTMGSLEHHVADLRTRLQSNLPADQCWDAFREESGSELVNRGSRMLIDGSTYGARLDRVGQICSDYALNVVQLRAQRQLTASAFAFLIVPLHAIMALILVFVLHIVIIFNSNLAAVSIADPFDATLGYESQATLEPGGSGLSLEDAQIPTDVTFSSAKRLFGASNAFESQDTTPISYMVVLVLVALTIANALASKFATGGSNLKIVSILSPLCIVSGVVLGVIPIVASYIFQFD